MELHGILGAVVSYPNISYWSQPTRIWKPNNAQRVHLETPHKKPINTKGFHDAESPLRGLFDPGQSLRESRQ